MKSKLSLIVLAYLRFWAKLQLKKNPRAIIIGVTGSAGKTSTRLAIVQILKNRGGVKHSVHANSESGIPLNILGLTLSTYSFLDWLRVMLLAPLKYIFWKESYDYYVVEMGIDSPHPPKNMAYLLSIIKPDIAIVLGASHVHTETFDPLVRDTASVRRRSKLLNLIASHKMLLARSVSPDGSSIINADSAALAPYIKDIKSRLLTFGTNQSSSLRIIKNTLSRRGTSVTFEYQNMQATLTLPDIFGKEYASTFAAAVGVALSLGVPLKQAISHLSSYRSPAGRMRVFAGIKGTHIIDSSYNASPDTVNAALATLDAVAPRNAKLLILGDMRELGSLSKQMHQKLAKKLAFRADTYVLYGEMMSKYVAPSLIREKKVVYNPQSMQELIAVVKKLLKPNMWVLVKGSQNKILLERAVESILENKDDIKNLARRGAYWDKIRQNTR
ncbi:MAG: hypothetical protein DPW11_01660 [bacterium]|nr:hypothetical protein [bacterium]